MYTTTRDVFIVSDVFKISELVLNDSTWMYNNGSDISYFTSRMEGNGLHRTENKRVQYFITSVNVSISLYINGIYIYI